MDYIKSSRGEQTYLKIMADAEKPMGERPKNIISNRGNVVKSRNYHLFGDKLENAKKQLELGVFPNPFRNHGVFFAVTQALINLGVNQQHSFMAVKNEMKNIMSQWESVDGNGWEEFVNKKPKNSLCAKDVNGRIIQNAMMLQRLGGAHPFGFKLSQLRACIDIYRGEHDLPKFVLRTGIPEYNTVSPVNEFKGLKKRGRAPSQKKLQKLSDGVICDGAECVLVGSGTS